MDSTILVAALGVLCVFASAAFFIFGRKLGRSSELATQRSAKSSAEELTKRILGDAEREAESARKSAVLSGKEELIKIRESWEVSAPPSRGGGT